MTNIIFFLTIAVLFFVCTGIWFIVVPRIIIRAVIVQITKELIIRDERLEGVKKAIKRAMISNETSLDPDNLNERIGFPDLIKEEDNDED